MRRGPWALLAVLSFVLTACGGLQSSGPVRPGLEVGGAGRDQVKVLPPAPQEDATQTQIIRGFLKAGAATGGDVSVARSFLTDPAGKAWVPDSGTVVLKSDDEVKLKRLSDRRWQLIAEAEATIDGSGRYQSVEPHTIVRSDVELELVDEQWRISGLEEGFGRWLTPGAVSRLLRPFDVHYVSTTSNTLIPDTRWLPLDRQATRLARAQLSAVPVHLRGAATTQTDLALVVDAVPVVDGVATVDLRAAGVPSKPAERRTLYAQLVSTLLQASDVEAVQVTVEGASLEAEGIAVPARSVESLGYFQDSEDAGGDLLLRVRNHVIPVTRNEILEGDVTGDEETPFPDIPQEWQDLAQSWDGTEVAGVTQGRDVLARWHTDARVHELPSFATNLGAPSFDRHGILWVPGQGEGGDQLWAINAAADLDDDVRSAPVPVKVPWLGRRIVSAARVSPDGQRIALVTTTASGKAARVEITGVVRQPNGLPSILAPESLRVAAELTTVRDVAWTSETALAIVGKADADRAIGIHLVAGGGQPSLLSQRPGALRISTIDGTRGLVVRSAAGLLLRAGGTWLTAPVGRTLLVPGG
ncbi:GerMN domain-containing protein [Janibacter sp. G1551]|uniref:GerMN domain-containing protein n=1 Tax=Janibacter sp. G1551 TaxID=3420440 RepID=UPI003CFBC99F